LTIPIVRVNTRIEKFAAKNFAGKFCLQPYNTVQISPEGDVRLCGCLAWMPITVGNIFQQSLISILSSPLAVEIRQSITQGTYDYCNEDVCGVIVNDQLIERQNLSARDLESIDNPGKVKWPTEIFLAGDMTCNLSCPSCRTSIIKLRPEEIERNEQLGKILTQNLFTYPSDEIITLHLSTTGELFSSPMLLNFLQNIKTENFPNLKIWIQTNGLLCKKFWHKIIGIESKIQNITVTIDAAQPDTYHRLRRGGKWDDILDNLSWLQQKKNEIGMTLHTRMVVQHQNYRQMKSFYDMSMKYNADQVDYCRLTNRFTYPPGEFAMHDVFDSAHPEYQLAMQHRQQVVDLPRSWFEGGI
jgi:MoaA/NifB/PqqE/SkfB family radical SAM enzyme